MSDHLVKLSETCLSKKKLLINFSNTSEIPTDFSLKISLSYHTLSKALDISTKKTPQDSRVGYASKAVYILWAMDTG